MSKPVTIEDIYSLFQKSQADIEYRIAEIKAQEQSRIAEIKAEEQRLVAEIKAEEQRLVAEIKAEEQRFIAEIKAKEQCRIEAAEADEKRRIEAAKADEKRRAEEEQRRIEAAEADEKRRIEEFERHMAALQAEEKVRIEDFERRMAEFRAEDERLEIEGKKRLQEIRELGKQIGGLGAKFGSFTEGLALPSMQKILGDRFGMEVISPSVRVRKAGQHLEIDVLAYANSDINRAYVVEVKSHPREESISQLKGILNKFRNFFPEHKDKEVYGILAAVDLPEDIKERILQEGLYVARISDDTFEMDIPDDFCPRVW